MELAASVRKCCLVMHQYLRWIGHLSLVVIIIIIITMVHHPNKIINYTTMDLNPIHLAHNLNSIER
jgi:hypothetical protein